jgi:hypothetical protein
MDSPPHALGVGHHKDAMMIVVGKTDAFERKYMEKFRHFASQFGEFVNYEHDRGARDIGLHLTHRLRSGKERLSTALCWFQMKGIMSETLSAAEFEKNPEVKLSLQVNHLRYWYLQPMPTYLVVYIESVDKFLVLNIQKHVTEKWGKAILSLDQETATITVPKDSELDDQAFHLILTKSDIEEWRKVLEAEDEKIRLCRRDYDLIWHIGTADERNVEQRILFMDWQSKTRSQFYIQERVKGSGAEWEDVREHWQYMMNIFDLEGVYPYLELYALNPDDNDEDAWWVEDDEEGEVPSVTFSNGDVVGGVNASWEYFEYKMGKRPVKAPVLY